MADHLGAFEQAVLLAVVQARRKRVRSRDSEGSADTAGARRRGWCRPRHPRTAREEESRVVSTRTRHAGSWRPGATLLSPAAQRLTRTQRRTSRHRQSVARPQVATERIRMTPTPPGWAEALLRVFLKPADCRQCVGRSSRRIPRQYSSSPWTASCGRMVRDAGARIRMAQRPSVGSAFCCGVRHANGARLACAAGRFPHPIDCVDLPWHRDPGVRGALGIHALWFVLRGHARRCCSDGASAP